MPRDNFYRFLRIHPVRVADAVRLYIAFASAFVLKVTRLKYRLGEFQIPGAFIPGRSNLLVTVDGVVASIRPKSGDVVLIAGMHEPLATSWFDVKTGQTVIDVGAHIGRYALVAAKKANSVIAVEPDPSNFRILRENIRLNGFRNITALNVALSDNIGSSTLYLQSGGNTGTSSLEAGWTHVSRGNREIGTIEVESRTLDGVASSLHLNSIDWLKIDVEGHEVHVLRGGKTALSLTQRLILEVSSKNVEECRRIVGEAGLQVRSVEVGEEVSNWFCVRGD